jgi:hypothetical protein
MMIMKYQDSNYEPCWQRKSDSSAEIQAIACESVLRKGAVLIKQTLLGSRNLLTLGGWSSIVHTARRRLGRNSLRR